MNRGPRHSNGQADLTFALKAAHAWHPVPDWIAALADHADAHGLKATGEKIGYSLAAVSTAISGKYAGDLGRVEEAVGGALMGAIVACPVLGEIGRDRCLAEQRKPRRATSSTSLRLHAACRNGCPNYRGGRS